MRRRMRNTDNIFDLVERAAADDGIPRLQLWQETARALIENDIPALNLSDLVNPTAATALTFGGWLPGFRNAVDRYNDPHRGIARVLKRIIVRKADFDRWLRKANKLRRGPARGTTGLRAVDRKAFPEISRLIKHAHMIPLWSMKQRHKSLTKAAAFARRCSTENKWRRACGPQNRPLL